MCIFFIHQHCNFSSSFLWVLIFIFLFFRWSCATFLLFFVLRFYSVSIFKVYHKAKWKSCELLAQFAIDVGLAYNMLFSEEVGQYFLTCFVQMDNIWMSRAYKCSLTHMDLYSHMCSMVAKITNMLSLNVRQSSTF